MELSFRRNYWHDAKARAAFKKFLRIIHHLDLSLWESTGFWDEHYVPFSYFNEDQVVSNVCIYSMPALIDGKRCTVAQVSGVGTLQEYRKRGLNRELTDIALEWAFRDHQFAFLFADDQAIEFYKKCGFRPIREYVERIQVSAVSSKPGLRKLDIMKDSEALTRLFEKSKHRDPVSNVFSNSNPELIMFHALYTLKEHIHYVRDIDAYVFVKRDGRRITVFDLIAQKVPDFEELLPYLSDDATEEVEFRFYTDKLGINGTQLIELKGNNPFLFGSCPLESKMIFPFTAHA